MTNAGIWVAGAAGVLGAAVGAVATNWAAIIGRKWNLVGRRGRTAGWHACIACLCQLFARCTDSADRASIEVLAVNTYKTALTLPYIGGSAANPVISKFATVTMGQHSQHLAAFNGALKQMGAKTQNQPDPR